MYCIALLQGLIFNYPITVLFKLSRGLSINEVFILESIFTILLVILDVPWGHYADRFGYKNTLIISNFLLFVSRIILYFSHSFLLFLLEIIIAALSVSGASGCASAFIYSSSDEKKSAKAFSGYSGFKTAGFFIASTASIFLIKYSYDMLVFLTIIPFFIAFIISWFLEDLDIKPVKNTIKSSFKNVFCNKDILVFVIAMALIAQSTGCICVYLNQPLYVKYGVNVKYFGMINAVIQLLCISSTKAYRFSEKIGESRFMITVFSIVAIGSFVLFYNKFMWVCIAIIALEEVSYMICEPISMNIQNRAIQTNDRATLLSAYSMVGNIISAIVIGGVGKAAQFSIESVVLFCGILSTIALVMVSMYFRHLSANNRSKM
jgi:MFS family permease